MTQNPTSYKRPGGGRVTPSAPAQKVSGVRPIIGTGNMEASMRNTASMNKRIDRLTSTLITQFEAAVGLLQAEETDLNSTAKNSLQMQVHTTSLVRATEETLTFIHQLQELWLFGQLETLKKSGSEVRMEEDAKAVAQLLRRLVKAQDVEGETDRP
ncbi:hypothetical protein W97_07572 [Coniosporium apollinis CBS 100218]|uniref:Mediator of RNA polymerase II transcription subunit 22 n=1 Tax=Coniosporium apollinis (strain CBS 100218) TaxID=1168221 RepID=R7Z2R0_CONA1|nr:uncharacterized protein W97_07572 [Coniosporium apollinis CBS 100218]EON68314.1 hypothetical protein W97_07572 [Coniosporium apollinis CBS 100218]